MRFPEKLLTICVLMLSVVDCSAQDIPEVSSGNIHLRGSLTNSKLVFEQSGKDHRNHFHSRRTDMQKIDSGRHL